MKLVGKNSNIVCCTFNVLHCTENLKIRQVKVSKTIPKGLWHYFKLAIFQILQINLEKNLLSYIGEFFCSVHSSSSALRCHSGSLLQHQCTFGNIILSRVHQENFSLQVISFFCFGCRIILFHMFWNLNNVPILCHTKPKTQILSPATQIKGRNAATLWDFPEHWKVSQNKSFLITSRSSCTTTGGISFWNVINAIWKPSWFNKTFASQPLPRFNSVLKLGAFVKERRSILAGCQIFNIWSSAKGGNEIKGNGRDLAKVFCCNPEFTLLGARQSTGGEQHQTSKQISPDIDQALQWNL